MERILFVRSVALVLDDEAVVCVLFQLYILSPLVLHKV